MSDRQTLQESLGKLSEGRGSRRQVTLITAGWGSSGYYSKDLLERDGPKVWPAGTHMYMNHPSRDEEYSRPERDVRDLAGVLVTTPRMVGSELQAECQIFKHYRETIDEIGPHIGVSIRAMGAAEAGEAEGREGNIISSLDEGLSADFVTKAGAGGKVGELLESARTEVEEELQLEEELLHFDESYLERDISRSERVDLAKKGQALPVRDADGKIINGRFPMATCEDVSNAAQSIGRGSAPNDQLKSFIKKVAEKLSCQMPFQTESGSGRTTKEAYVADEKRLSELEESVRQLTEDKEKREQELAEAKQRADRAEDALMLERARRVVNEAMDADANEGEDALPELPERALGRVRESVLRSKLPLKEDKTLDEGKLVEATHKEMRQEAQYLTGGSSSGKVTGMGSVNESGNGGGGTGSEELTEAEEKELIESFKRTGMSEEAATVAARGR